MSYNDNSRYNDGLDTSRTTDAYSDNNSRGNTGDYRSNDGLDASNTIDAYGSSNTQSSGTYRNNDGLDPTSTTDARGGSDSYGTDSESRNDRPGGTSGGLGKDDTIGSAPRTGGGQQRGGDQETSQHTSGGLGENDTYGDEADTGGNDTGYDHNYGMGSGRTVTQEEGGPLPTEPGRDDIRRQGEDFDDRHGPYKSEYDAEDGSSKSKDSTAGKLMEKAGGLLGNRGLVERGEERRREAGARGDEY